VGHTCVVAADRHAPGIAAGIVESHLNGTGRIGNVYHAQPVSPVGHICVVVADRHAPGLVAGIVEPHLDGTGRI